MIFSEFQLIKGEGGWISSDHEFSNSACFTISGVVPIFLATMANKRSYLWLSWQEV